MRLSICSALLGVTLVCATALVSTAPAYAGGATEAGSARPGIGQRIKARIDRFKANRNLRRAVDRQIKGDAELADYHKGQFRSTLRGKLAGSVVGALGGTGIAALLGAPVTVPTFAAIVTGFAVSDVHTAKKSARAATIAHAEKLGRPIEVDGRRVTVDRRGRLVQAEPEPAGR